MQSHKFHPYVGINDKIQLERIRRDIVSRMRQNERQLKLLDHIIEEYPFEANIIARQKNYMLAIQEYRKDLAEIVSKLNAMT